MAAPNGWMVTLKKSRIAVQPFADCSADTSAAETVAVTNLMPADSAIRQLLEHEIDQRNYPYQQRVSRIS